jgi:anti-anti-sigma regulatory factor
VTCGRRLGHHDHLCWPYHDLDDFVSVAVEFLADGVALGQRIAYIGDGSAEVLRTRIGDLDGIDDLLDRGAATVQPVEGVYRAGGTSPESQVASYRAATQAALEDGYQGLRVAAEATALVRTARIRELFSRYEHLVDRAMRDLPFAALCGYDRSQLEGDALLEIACMHPLVREGASSFQVYAPAGADLGLVGEVDAMVSAAFARALERTGLDAAGSPVVHIDASHLDFLDHNAILELERLAQAEEILIVLQDAPTVVGRLVELLGLEQVEVEARA